MIETPRVDPRDRADVVAQLRQLVPRYAPGWRRPPGRPWPGGDPGAALVEIFARFAEVVIERLNRAPDKNFLAFLDMIGVSLLPPAPARAPVTFTLAAGAVDDALVPRGTPLATRPPAPQNFETERGLVVSPARLSHAFTLDARRDRFTDHGDGRQDRGVFTPFVGGTLIGHVLYLAQSTVFDVARPTRLAVTLDLAAVPPRDLPFLAALLSTLSWWARRDGAAARVAMTATLSTPLRGTAHTAGASSTTLTGVGAAFLEELAPGDLIAIGDAGLRRVNAVTAAAVTVNTPVTVPGPPGVALRRVIGRRLAGTVHTGGVASTQVTGAGTSFAGELRVGDSLVIPGAGTRTVSAIASDAALTLDAPVTIAGPPGVEAVRVAAAPTAAAPDRALPLRLEAVDDGFTGAEAWTVGGATQRWLWARTELPMPPATVLPLVESVTVRSSLPSPVSADHAFANSAPIDLTKGGFFPFGERPRINDTLYLGSDEIFGKPGARVTAAVTLGFPVNPDGSSTVTLAWEFWKGDAWALLGTTSSGGVVSGGFQLTDASRAFTLAGARTVTFRCPEIEPSDVNGQKSRWIRVRIAAGGYGEDARLAKTRTAPQPSLADWDFTPASYRPPFISDLDLSYAYESGRPVDAIARENTFAVDRIARNGDATWPAFAPFVPPPDEPPALYAGFDRAFSNNAFSLYLAVGEQAEPPTSPLVVWEYRAAGEWRNLGARDDTAALTQPGLVESIGPADFAESERFGRRRFWLRARLEAGEPERFALGGVHPNTTWAVQAVTFQDEVLGSSAGKPAQVFTLSRSPVLSGQAVAVREPEPPSAPEIARLEAAGEREPVMVVRDDVRKTVEVWVRWHEVDNFHLSDAEDRHYVIERATGRVRFGDGVRGMIPPPGRDNVRALRYQAGGGALGNVPAGAITVMKRAISSVEGVFNPFPAVGGADQESLDEVRARGPLVLKHRERAVAYEDYEWLAEEASLQVARVRCFGARDAGTAGAVTLLIVPRSDDPRPFPAPGLVRRVREYLDARRTPTADLAIVGPAYVEVSVTAEVVPVSFEQADLVRRRVVAALDAFLHPLRGGPGTQGWPFGRDVFVSEITTVIEATEGVDHVVRARLSGRDAAGDRTRDDGRRVELSDAPGELPAAGPHAITMAAG